MDNHAEVMSFVDLVSGVSCLNSIAAQDADPNTGLTAITYLWVVIDAAARRPDGRDSRGKMSVGLEALWAELVVGLSQLALGGSRAEGSSAVAAAADARLRCRQPGQGIVAIQIGLPEAADFSLDAGAFDTILLPLVPLEAPLSCVQAVGSASPGESMQQRLAAATAAAVAQARAQPDSQQLQQQQQQRVGVMTTAELSLSRLLASPTRPDVRGSALQTVFSAMAAHCGGFPETLWQLVLAGVALPLAYEVTSTATSAASMAEGTGASDEAGVLAMLTAQGLSAITSSGPAVLGRGRHGSAKAVARTDRKRETAAAQWRETRVLCYQGLVRVVCAGFAYLNTAPWFHECWSALLALLERSVVGQAGEANGSDWVVGARSFSKELGKSRGEEEDRLREALALESKGVTTAALMCARELALLVCVPAGVSDAQAEERYSLGMRVVDGALVKVADDDESDSDSAGSVGAQGDELHFEDDEEDAPGTTGRSGTLPQADALAGKRPVGRGSTRAEAAAAASAALAESVAKRESLWRDVFSVFQGIVRSRAALCDASETVLAPLIDVLRSVICAAVSPRVVSGAGSSFLASYKRAVDPSCVLGTPRAGVMLRLVSTLLQGRLRVRWAQCQTPPEPQAAAAGGASSCSSLIPEEIRWPRCEIMTTAERGAASMVERVAAALVTRSAAHTTAVLAATAATEQQYLARVLPDPFIGSWAELIRLTLSLSDPESQHLRGLGVPDTARLVMPTPALTAAALKTLERVARRAGDAIPPAAVSLVFHPAVSSLATMLLVSRRASTTLRGVLTASGHGEDTAEVRRRRKTDKKKQQPAHHKPDAAAATGHESLDLGLMLPAGRIASAAESQQAARDSLDLATGSIVPVHVWGVGAGGAFATAAVSDAARAHRLVAKTEEAAQAAMAALAALISRASVVAAPLVRDSGQLAPQAVQLASDGTLAAPGGGIDDADSDAQGDTDIDTGGRDDAGAQAATAAPTGSADRLEERLTALCVALEGMAGIPEPLSDLDDLGALQAAQMAASLPLRPSPDDGADGGIALDSDALTDWSLNACFLVDDPALAFGPVAPGPEGDPSVPVTPGRAPVAPLPPASAHGIIAPLLGLNRSFAMASPGLAALLPALRALDAEQSSTATGRAGSYAALQAALSTSAFVSEHFAAQTWASRQLPGAAMHLGWPSPPPKPLAPLAAAARAPEAPSSPARPSAGRALGMPGGSGPSSPAAAAPELTFPQATATQTSLRTGSTGAALPRTAPGWCADPAVLRSLRAVPEASSAAATGADGYVLLAVVRCLESTPAEVEAQLSTGAVRRVARVLALGSLGLVHCASEAASVGSEAAPPSAVAAADGSPTLAQQMRRRGFGRAALGCAMALAVHTSSQSQPRAHPDGADASSAPDAVVARSGTLACCLSLRRSVELLWVFTHTEESCLRALQAAESVPAGGARPSPTTAAPMAQALILDVIWLVRRLPALFAAAEMHAAAATNAIMAGKPVLVPPSAIIRGLWCCSEALATAVTTAEPLVRHALRGAIIRVAATIARAESRQAAVAAELDAAARALQAASNRARGGGAEDDDDEDEPLFDDE
jgi:hypothetical protein